MKAKLFVSEAGMALFDEKGNPIASKKFESPERFYRLMNSLLVEELDALLSDAKGIDEIANPWQEVQPLLEEKGVKAVLQPELKEEMEASKPSLMVKAGLVKDEMEALEKIREYAIYESERKIREKAAQPDLQVVQAVQAVDDLDRTFNLVSMRVREWYGLHFPELDNLVEDPYSYIKFVAKIGKRENVDEERLKELGISGNRAKVIVDTAMQSKGGDMRDEDVDAVVSLAELAIQIRRAREKLTRHVERNMKRIAPNITAIAGPTIGARLLARAGGLEKLAKLPASTIQVLGAEKALFRALRKGTKPPKHGILFQHPLVHSAPRWQRGKIARVIAAKLALAARIDLYRSELEEGLVEKLKERVKEIKEKYPKPKKVVKKKKVRRRGRKRGP